MINGTRRRPRPSNITWALITTIGITQSSIPVAARVCMCVCVRVPLTHLQDFDLYFKTLTRAVLFKIRPLRYHEVSNALTAQQRVMLRQLLPLVCLFSMRWVLC